MMPWHVLQGLTRLASPNFYDIMTYSEQPGARDKLERVRVLDVERADAVCFGVQRVLDSGLFGDSCAIAVPKTCFIGHTVLPSATIVGIADAVASGRLSIRLQDAGHPGVVGLRVDLATAQARGVDLAPAIGTWFSHQNGRLWLAAR